MFGKFAWDWHETCVVGAGRRESEVESTKSIITLHLEPAFGRMPLKTIDARLIDRYKAEKSAEISPYKRPFSPKSINNHLGEYRPVRVTPEDLKSDAGFNEKLGGDGSGA